MIPSVLTYRRSSPTVHEQQVFDSLVNFQVLVDGKKTIPIGDHCNVRCHSAHAWSRTTKHWCAELQCCMRTVAVAIAYMRLLSCTYFCRDVHHFLECK